MRPALLNPLFAGLGGFAGVGPKTEALLARLTGRGEQGVRPLDLLWRLPSGLIDRRARPRLADAAAGAVATVALRVDRHSPPPSGGRAPYRVFCSDGGGEIELAYFHADPRHLQRLLPVGETRIVSGRIERYADRLQMLHPDYVLPLAELASLPLLEPVYPLVQGLTQKLMRRIIAQALDVLPPLPEWLGEDLPRARRWPGFSEALRLLHQPATDDDLAAQAAARERLAFDELFASQLSLALLRLRLRSTGGRAVMAPGALASRIRAALPFALTASQETALAEIESDMAAPRRMLRLLQGDVGAGKTVVALLAMARAVEAGAQAALMAPTEILARQHYETIARLARPAGLRSALLTGREQGAARSRVLADLRDGAIDVLAGTHALLQADVAFSDLALAVIDEQHRFGVRQRLALQAKGPNGGADVLVMTATPIPRTLLMTHYGDMDVSRLTEKPPGRWPVVTRAAPLERLGEVVSAIARARAQGAQIYWVCPLAEASEALDVSAAETRAAHLRTCLGGGVGLVHGRMKAAEKDAVMEAFASGAVGVLVATTVIEVGVDAPGASIMVIENAERLGLAQLHQLRGRVGRGSARSSCVLLYQGPLSDVARARLAMIRRTDDGFVIAEEDLRLRGGGEILGVRQSGEAALRMAKFPDDADLLGAAREAARLLLARDPDLKGPGGEAARLCLHLFERSDALRLTEIG